MVHVVLTIPKPSVWSMENVVNAFPRSIERTDWAEDSYLLYARPNNGLVLNAMGPDLPINMWSLTALNFFFSLIVISMLRSLLDWELSSI